MTRSRATARAAGTRWETEIVRALVDAGWPNAERRRLAGSEDKGDIAGVIGVCIEAKNTNRLDLAGAMKEARREGFNAGAVVSVAWLKRRGKQSAEDGYVVLDGATFMQLLAEAGYR